MIAGRLQDRLLAVFSQVDTPAHIFCVQNAAVCLEKVTLMKITSGFTADILFIFQA